jgi:phosphonate degradation associated HDIG domain protein
MPMTDRAAATIVDELFHLFGSLGHTAYFGEAVSQTEHALQSAHLAESEWAPDEQIVAALLHDVGHLMHGRGEGIADRGVDSCHEDQGAAWLAQHFAPGIVEPIRLHVDAKRYLCAVDPEYRELLSPASLVSLELQGGPMTRAEVAEFEQSPYFCDALRLRGWDDAAKVPGLEVPGLEYYRERLQAALRKSVSRLPSS